MDYKLDNQLLFDFHIALCKYLYYEIPVIIEIKTTCFYNLYKIYVRNKAEIFIKLHSSKYEVFYSGKSIYINTKKEMLKSYSVNYLKFYQNLVEEIYQIFNFKLQIIFNF